MSVVAKKKDKSGELYLYDAIGVGWFGGISAQEVADALKEIGEVDTLDVFVNSPGGDVFDGLAIYNQLKRIKARKVVHIDGLAASIASVICMAGDEIRIASNARMMIHRAWGLCVGNCDDMRKNADVLDSIDVTLQDTYLARTKADRAQIKKWMDDETWMTAAEAKSRGFADAIDNDNTEATEAASRYDFANKFKFKHTPSDLVAKSRDPRLVLARMQHRVNALRRASPAKT